MDCVIIFIRCILRCTNIIAPPGTAIRVENTTGALHKERDRTKMDNNYSQRPRKRISKETARKRQLTALSVIALIVLIIVILIAKGCSKDRSKESKGSSNTNANIITTTTMPSTEPIVTTITEPVTEVTTLDPEAGAFKMQKYTYQLNVGETETAWIDEYPAGSGEADERWSSSDDSIATVDSYGHITAVAPGECYITVRSALHPEQEAQVKVKVFDDTGSIQTPQT